MTTVQTPTQQPPHRLLSIDFTRGLVIVIMALDHIRDLLHTDSLTQDPVDIETTTPALFFTRWITHFCAPIFVFLAGASAFLMMKSQDNRIATRRFLFTRGLWLILLELTVVSFGIWSDIKFRTVLLQVIFGIGSGFVILSALLKLPARVIGFTGLAIVLLHDLLPAQSFGQHNVSGTGGNASLLWEIFIQGGFYKLGADRGIIIGYPVIPWLGIMLSGFGFASVFNQPQEKRRRIFLWSGAGALLLFAILRTFNVYGDPKPWQLQPDTVFSVLSFININKYPPSLLYTAVTLGVMFFILFLADGRSNRFTAFFATFGRVPMFFYLLHWYVIHASMFVMLFMQGVSTEQFKFGLMQFGRPQTGVGLELPFLYVYWICLILAMYPVCRWYGKYKAANRHKKWLAYL